MVTNEMADILVDLSEYYLMENDIQKYIKVLSYLTGLPNLKLSEIEEITCIEEPSIGLIASDYSGIGDFDDIEEFEG